MLYLQLILLMKRAQPAILALRTDEALLDWCAGIMDCKNIRFANLAETHNIKKIWFQSKKDYIVWYIGPLVLPMV